MSSTGGLGKVMLRDNLQKAGQKKMVLHIKECFQKNKQQNISQANWKEVLPTEFVQSLGMQAEIGQPGLTRTQDFDNADHLRSSDIQLTPHRSWCM
jgi:hypothetical protein